MRRWIAMSAAALALMAVLEPAVASAEILAMLNYESKPEQTMRREGIAVIDVDPASASFGKLLMDIPLPPDLVAHHIFYNKDASKAYVTALGRPELRVIDMTRFPYRMSVVAVPDCQVGEDLVFSDDSKTWYLTCMGSSAVVVGDATLDQPLRTITADGAAFIKYPHGIAIVDGIDRILVTSTVRPSDLGDPGETVSVIEASTGRVLSTHKMSDKPSPAGVAPVEVMSLPGAEPPLVYVTNMFGGTLWLGAWDPGSGTFAFRQAFDVAAAGAGVPLEMYVNGARDRLYVSAANPGHLLVFDIAGDPTQPKLLQTIATAAGAHHVAFSPDGKLAFVQNSLLNLPGMSDGSITVVDLAAGKAVASVDTLKNMGLNPNCIVLLPEWHGAAAH
ncbi:MAG: YncE family protein [Alphaproteobacteria bacterium]